MKLFPSMETIAFQKKSPLGETLVKIFQETIDFRDQRLGQKNKVSDTIIFFKKSQEAKLKEAIRTHCGIEVTFVHYSDAPCGAFAMIPIVGNASTTNLIAANWEANQYPADIAKTIQEHTGEKPLTAEQLEEISKRLDLETGKFDVSGLKLPEKTTVAMELVMDLYSMFFAKESMHVQLEYLTAEECAEIYIHEIGHILTYIEHASVEYHKFDMLQKLDKKFFESSAPLKEKAKYLRKNLENYSPEDKSESTLKDGTATLVEQIEKESTAGDPKTEYRLNLILVLISKLWKLVKMPKQIFCSFINAGSTTDLGWQDLKISDIAVNRKMFSTIEMAADEFVARHGFGQQSATVLLKMESYGKFFNIVNGDGYNTLRNSKAYANLCLLNAKIVYMLNETDDENYRSHENFVNRSKRARLNITELFKDANLPHEMLVAYLRQYDVVEKSIESAIEEHKSRRSAILAPLIKLFHAITNGDNIYAILTTANFRNRYADVFTAIEKLMTNSLYHKAAKLDSMS